MTVVTMIVALTTTSWGVEWGGGGDRRWSTPENWDPDGVPGVGTTAEIGNGDSVVLENNGQPSIGHLIIEGGSTLILDADFVQNQGGFDIYLGGKRGTTTGTITQRSGTFTPSDDIKCSDGGGGEYYMKGGTFSTDAGGYFELGLPTSLLEISGGSFTVGNQVRYGSGTIRVIGNGATLIQLTHVTGAAAGATYEFVPNAAGLITPITVATDAETDILLVNLDALSGPSTMTLFTTGWVDAFNTITITKDGTPLTPGTEGALNAGEYFLAGTSTGVPGAGDDVVLSVNVGVGSTATPGKLIYKK